jgi:hypothetical protein
LEIIIYDNKRYSSLEKGVFTMKKQRMNAGGGSMFVMLWIVLTMLSAVVFAQTGGGYINYAQVMGDPLNLTLGDIDVQQSPNWNNVKSIGMGKTQTADGRFYNGMLANPALLGESRTRIDAFGLQASFPKATFDATSFLKKNMHQFKKADFLHLLGDGFSDYYNAETAEQQRAAVRKINQALAFPNELFDKIVGDSLNPMTHGIEVIPSVQAQVGQWGFSLFGWGQVGFVVEPGTTTSKLLSLHIPENTDNLSVDVIRNLAEIVGSLFDENGDVSPNALPQAFAMSHIDIVGAIGRAYTVRPNLNVGASVKVVNRRFSTKLINPDNLDRVLSEARTELKHTATGVTLDLGMLYESPTNGARFGFSVLNALPMKTITSSTSFDFVIPTGASYIDDGTGNPAVGSVDLAGNFYPDPQGDTLLVIENSDVHLKQPFRLKAPMLANVGVVVPIQSNWDVAVDLVDMLSKDDTYSGLADRVRVGTEYRIANFKPAIALRGGFAERHLTLGAGIRMWKLQLDVAYARDPFLEKNAWFSQVQVGW